MASSRVLATLPGDSKPVFNPYTLFPSVPTLPRAQVVEVASGRVLATLPGDSEPVTALAWSPCGRRAYTASRSLQQRAWDIAPLVAAGRAAAEAAAVAGPDALPGARVLRVPGALLGILRCRNVT